MVGNENISKTLRMLHEAARYEFDCNHLHKAIDILNDAKIIELTSGFKNQAAETMLQISNTYFDLKNYDLALWFAREAIQLAQRTKKTSIQKKATNLLENIITEESNCKVTENILVQNANCCVLA